jgi:hypothetical protein
VKSGSSTKGSASVPQTTSLTKGFGAPRVVSVKIEVARSRRCVGNPPYARLDVPPTLAKQTRHHTAVTSSRAGRPKRPSEIARQNLSRSDNAGTRSSKRPCDSQRNRSRERRTTNYRINLIDACVDCGRTKRDEDHADPLEWMHCSMLLLNTSVQ